jgi:hypothetical protein
MRGFRISRLIGTVTLAFTFGAAAPSADTTKRPIQDWITPNLSGGSIFWFDGDQPQTGDILFDYFGSNNAAFSLNLGTSIDGTVTEIAQPDGTAQVHVVMHTQNALSWAFSEGFKALIFGHTPSQVKSGLDPALADTLVTVDFINSAPGAPLPSLFRLFFVPSPHYTIQKMSLVASATGTLRSAFGVPDGTPGVAHTTQRGLFNVPGLPNNGQTTFPAEKVDIHEIR